MADSGRQINEFIKRQFPYPYSYWVPEDFGDLNAEISEQLILACAIASRYYDADDYRFYFADDAGLYRLFNAYAFGPHSYRLACKFIEQFLAEIRQIICDKKRHTEAARLTNQKLSPLAASLSTLVLGHFGVAEPIAIGVATYILIVVMEASRGAFCKTTDADVLAALRYAEAPHSPVARPRPPQ